MLYKSAIFTILNLLKDDKIKEKQDELIINNITFFLGEIINFIIEDRPNPFKINFTNDPIKNEKLNLLLKNYLISTTLQIITMKSIFDDYNVLTNLLIITLTYLPFINF